MTMRNEYAEYPALHMAVEVDLWRRVKAGDAGAVKELQAKAGGLVLYDHILCMGPGYEWVSIDELYEHHIIRALRLYQEIPAD